MRHRILILLLILCLTSFEHRALNSVLAQDAKNTAAVNSYTSIQVILKRSATETISFALDDARHFECIHTWTHEVPATAITGNSTEKLEVWSKKTVTNFNGTLSEVDCRAFNEVYQQLALHGIIEDSVRKASTWVIIAVNTIDKRQIGYKAEYKKYDKDAAKMEAFLKVVLALTERLK